jgi:hypothetical protein
VRQRKELSWNNASRKGRSLGLIAFVRAGLGDAIDFLFDN